MKTRKTERMMMRATSDLKYSRYEERRMGEIDFIRLFCDKFVVIRPSPCLLPAHLIIVQR